MNVEARNRKQVRRQLIDMAFSAIGMIYLGLCHYVPQWLNYGDGPARNPECKMPMLKYNDLYAVCFLLPSFIGNLVFVTGYGW